MKRSALLNFLIVATLCLCTSTTNANEESGDGVDFFETKIRPVLVQYCYECHAADSKKVLGGLLLDTRESIRNGGDSGAAVVPGDLDESLLLDAIRYDSFEMPPKQKLPDEVIADFEKWIKMGAPDPREGPSEYQQSEIDIESGRQFWSFQLPEKREPPDIANSEWPDTSIDHFIHVKHQEKGLVPVDDATREVLIRRATFALIGLPPTPEDIDKFVNDSSSTPEAFAQVVDRLLDSSHYGERWGRHWLDIVRFAESSGGGRSLMFKDAWRFRDYIIQSFNQDKPVDRLIQEHIAGDLLPYDSWQQRSEQLIGTGFLVLGPTNYEQQDKEFLRMDVIDEQLNTMGRAFMGMTLNCARCHDHKFDPIPTEDYYALAGIMGNTQSLTFANVSHFVERRLPIDESLHPQLNQLEKELADVKEKLEKSKKYLAKLQKKNPDEVKKIDITQQQIKSLTAEQADLREKLKPLKPIAMSVHEVEKPRNEHLHIRGAVRNLGPEIPRGFLTVIENSEPFAVKIPDNQSGRLELADWITDEKNPLTARVYVNRIWRQLFGTGLVRTPDNFGGTGEIPSHPELLDYLAIQFMEQGWSTKKLIREIMLSRVYRMKSENKTENASIDVDNRFIWRANRRRLEAEALRDSILYVSGQLDLTPGGFTIRKLTAYDYGYQFDTVRRSVYVPVFRSAMMDFFEVFDVANPNLVVGDRTTSTLATQSLYLMNSPFMVTQSRFTAQRLLTNQGMTDSERINLLYSQALGRVATEQEMSLALAYLQNLSGNGDDKVDRLESWSSLCHSVLSCLDFLYVE